MSGFDWTPLGGETFAATLTATERRVIEALDPDGGTVRYLDILSAVWPDRRHADPPTYRETQRIRAHRARLVPKMAAIGWAMVTREGYGIALRPVSTGVAEPATELPPVAEVRLGPREARWALRLAAFMAKRAETAGARAESARLANVLRLALDGYESARRRRCRAQNAAYKAAHADEVRAYQAVASRRYREKQEERRSA